MNEIIEFVLSNLGVCDATVILPWVQDTDLKVILIETRVRPSIGAKALDKLNTKPGFVRR